MMFDDKKELNKILFTPIRNPTAADTCQLHANAVRCFPGEEIVAARLDIASAYNRIRVHPLSVPLGALYFEATDGTEMVALPMVEWFGSQDSNFHFQMVTDDCTGRSAARCMESLGCQLTTMYTDDFIVFGSASFVRQEMDRFRRDAEEIVGDEPINEKKTVAGSGIEAIGFTMDTTDNHAIGLSPTIFLKAVCGMYEMLPLNLTPGDTVEVAVLQSLASRAIRCADVVQAMAPYSRGFSANLRGLRPGATTAHLSGRACEDAWMWRVVLKLGFSDRRWLRVPIRIPLLHRHGHGEDAVERSHRQAAAADMIVFADACTSHGQGMGYYAPGHGWMSTSLPDLQSLVGADGQQRETDINVLEFVAALLGITALLPGVLLRQATLGPSTHTHIHLWTDNTACMSWMLLHRAAHPLHLYLCQVLTLLRLAYNVTLTVGHIPGTRNVFADAASRNFDQPAGDPAIRSQLEGLPLLPYPKCLTDAICVAATTQFVDIWSRVHAALTALGGVRGWTSQQRTVSAHCF